MSKILSDKEVLEDFFENKKESKFLHHGPPEIGEANITDELIPVFIDPDLITHVFEVGGLTYECMVKDGCPVELEYDGPEDIDPETFTAEQKAAVQAGVDAAIEKLRDHHGRRVSVLGSHAPEKYLWDD